MSKSKKLQVLLINVSKTTHFEPIEKLIQSELSVIVLCQDEVTFNLYRSKGITCYIFDKNTRESLTTIFKLHQPFLVVHLDYWQEASEILPGASSAMQEISLQLQVLKRKCSFLIFNWCG